RRPRQRRRHLRRALPPAVAPVRLRRRRRRRRLDVEGQQRLGDTGGPDRRLVAYHRRPGRGLETGGPPALDLSGVIGTRAAPAGSAVGGGAVHAGSFVAGQAASYRFSVPDTNTAAGDPAGSVDFTAAVHPAGGTMTPGLTLVSLTGDSPQVLQAQ